MKTSAFSLLSFRFGLFVGISSLSGLANAQFVAFNDHVPTNQPQTHINATTLNALTGLAAGTNLVMKDITTGSPTPVTLTVSRTGAATGGAGAGVPNPGTPAALTFNNFVYFGSATGSAIQTRAADHIL